MISNDNWKISSKCRIIRLQSRSCIELFLRKLRHLMIWKGMRNGKVIKVLKERKGHRWLRRRVELWFRCRGGIRRDMAWLVKGISCRRLRLCNQVKVQLGIIRKARKQVWFPRIRFRSQRTSTGISLLSKVGHLNRQNKPNIIKVSNRQLANVAQRNAKTAIQELVSWKSSKTQKEAFQLKEEATEIA